MYIAGVPTSIMIHSFKEKDTFILNSDKSDLSIKFYYNRRVSLSEVLSSLENAKLVDAPFS